LVRSVQGRPIGLRRFSVPQNSEQTFFVPTRAERPARRKFRLGTTRTASGLRNAEGNTQAIGARSPNRAGQRFCAQVPATNPVPAKIDPAQADSLLVKCPSICVPSTSLVVPEDITLLRSAALQPGAGVGAGSDNCSLRGRKRCPTVAPATEPLRR